MGVKDLELTETCLWILVANIKKKSARFVSKRPSYVNFSIFLRWRVAAVNVILSLKRAKIANDQYLELNGEP